MKNSRRNFIQQTAMSMAAAAALPLAGNATNMPFKAEKKEASLPIGFAGYTFAKYDLDKSIEMMKRLNVLNLSVKDFHLPLNSTQAQANTVMDKFKAAGINVYAVGVIYIKSQEAVDQAFEYAKRVGVNMIVGVPNYELLDYTEQKVKDTGIRMAIHNHGPEDKLYPGPGQVYERIANRDIRMGLCLDIGHATRAGVDPVKAVKQYKDRLFDMHIKDVSLKAQDGKAIEVGRGVIDFEELVEALNKIKFTGFSSIEYEKDMTDSLAGMAESIGYFRGVINCVG